MYLILQIEDVFGLVTRETHIILVFCDCLYSYKLLFVSDIPNVSQDKTNRVN
jgi:hypothetical protein